MSSAVISTSAARGRPFIFDDESVPEVSLAAEPELSEEALSNQPHPPCPVRPADFSGTLASAKLASVTPASRLNIRPAPEMVSSGIPAIDALTGGLPRGCITEICGPASSGRTSLLLAALAAATHRGEFCALVDASDALDPQSAAASGIMLDRLLWVRCGESVFSQNSPRMRTNLKTARPGLEFSPTGVRQYEHCLEQVLRATDLLLESGGFGLIVLDLADLPPQAARHIPLATWFRFRRAIEHTPTILLSTEQQAIAGSCSSLLLQLSSSSNREVMGEEKIPICRKRSESSRESAAWESPARQCRVNMEKENESRIDDSDRVDTNDADCALDDGPKTNSLTHAQLLSGLDINAEIIRTRLERKPARSISFTTKTAWAG
jgi:hypothetical protein